MPRSIEGFEFSASIDSTGEHVVLVAHKEDHEACRTEVFRLPPLSAGELIDLLIGATRDAKLRRKAMRRAAREAEATG